MATVNGMEKMVNHILEIGNKANQAEKVYKFGLMKIDIKDNFWMDWSMDLALIISIMEITLLDNIDLENPMDLEDIYGKVEQYFKVISRMDLSKALENGENHKIQ